MQVYLNGKYIPKAEATIPVDDRGFLFSDGVYELTRALRGRLVCGDRHWARLNRGLTELRIEGSGLTEQTLEQIATRLLTENGLIDGDAAVYVQVTRGAASPRLHVYPADTPPTVYVATTPFASSAQLQRNGVAAITLPDNRWARCDMKTISLLPNTMARQRAKEAGAMEAIFVRDGVVTEGAATNVFAVIDGEIRTHPISNYILPGVMRSVVLETAAELGYRVNLMPIFEQELERVEELFLTGTTIETLPVVRLDDRPVGEGRPGPIAAALLEATAQRLGLTELVGA